MTEKKEVRTSTHSSKTKVEESKPQMVEFLHEALYEIEVPAGLFVCRTVGEKVQPGDVLADVSPQAGEEAVPYTGKPVVKAGETVEAGGVLAKKGFLRKRQTKSPVSGVIQEVTPDLITIDVTQETISSLSPREPIHARSDARVAAISTDAIVLTFPAVALNMLALKGDSAHGVLRSIAHDDCKDKKKLPPDIEHSIVITDRLTPDSYPVISSLGARVILTETMEYTIFRDIVPLSITIGIIGGFGDIPHDAHLFSYLAKKEGTYCYFDSAYQRLLIPEEKAPAGIK